MEQQLRTSSDKNTLVAHWLMSLPIYHNSKCSVGLRSFLLRVAKEGLIPNCLFVAKLFWRNLNVVRCCKLKAMISSFFARSMRSITETFTLRLPETRVGGSKCC